MHPINRQAKILHSHGHVNMQPRNRGFRRGAGRKGVRNVETPCHYVNGLYAHARNCALNRDIAFKLHLFCLYVVFLPRINMRLNDGRRHGSNTPCEQNWYQWYVSILNCYSRRLVILDVTFVSGRIGSESVV